MKEYFCDELNNVLTCFHDKIMSCCSGQIGPVYFDKYRGEKIDWDKFRQVKLDGFAMLNEEQINNSPCKNCFNLREKKEGDVILPKFKMLYVSHWLHCNCGCVYCARMVDSHGKISHWKRNSEFYKLSPLLKELYKQDLLDRENLIAFIQGGDIGVLREFDEIVKIFLKNGLKEFWIVSNNIVYQPLVKKLLDANKALFVTTLDCGSREMYKKIKRVDKFNDYIKNLKKYLHNCNYKDRLHVKYIVVENLNDNVKEITDFINLMSDIGVDNVEFMIDNKYLLFTDLDKHPMPAHYKDLYLEFVRLCEEKHINIHYWERTRYAVNKYFLQQ